MQVMAALLVLGGTYIFISAILRDGSLSLIILGAGNVLLGLAFYLQSIRPAWLYPRLYIHISGKLVEYRLWSFQKITRIRWNAVDSIHIEKGNILFRQSGLKDVRLKSGHLPSSDEKRVISHIRQVAEGRGIPVGQVEQGAGGRNHNREQKR